MQPSQAVAMMIEVPPLPVGEMIIERGPRTTFRTSEGGVASVSKPKIDLALLRVERNPLDPPGFLESQKSGEESPVTHGWDPMRGNGYRSSVRAAEF